MNQWQRDRINGIFESSYFETSRLHAEGVEEALEILKKSGGKVITMSKEEVKRMRAKAIEEVWPKVAEKSDASAKGVALWKQF